MFFHVLYFATTTLIPYNELSVAPQKPPNDPHGREDLRVSLVSARLHPGGPLQEARSQGARHRHPEGRAPRRPQDIHREAPEGRQGGVRKHHSFPILYSDIQKGLHANTTFNTYF